MVEVHDAHKRIKGGHGICRPVLKRGWVQNQVSGSHGAARVLEVAGTRARLR
jgi:hypothetical protein